MKPARLVFVGPSGETNEIVLEEQATIGRAPDNDVVLREPMVSRQHARIRRSRDGGFLLLDLGSANGTYCNGQRVMSPLALRSGDVIRVGATPLTFLLDPGEPSRPHPGGVAENRTATEGAPEGEPVVLGSGPAMAEVLELIATAAESPIPVLIFGETGTGKEVAARAIHRGSRRAEGPFVAVNCASLPDPLLESHLFGHHPGALTEASQGCRGLFEAASGGTIFLDQVGDMPVATQARLLRAIENREITPLGQSQPVTIDVRVIAATNRDLASQVSQGSFREDLYYRLAAFPIWLPPLRDRPEDVPLLATRFLSGSARLHDKRISGIEPEAVKLLAEFDWPGNVRELRNEIHRAVALAPDGSSIGVAQLSPKLTASPEGGRGGRATEHVPADAIASPGTSVFRREGEYWTIVHEGTAIRLRDAKGLQYIAHLLRHPGHEFSALELVSELVPDARGPRRDTRQLGQEHLSPSRGADAGPALDAKAKTAYRARLTELREELDEAERFADTGRAERARAEIDFIASQLKAALGLGGRDRPIASDAERARVTVTLRIKNAVAKIQRGVPSLGHHLSAAIKTGRLCSYQPDPARPIAWSL